MAVWLIWRQRAARRDLQVSQQDPPCAFGYKTAWIAVRTRDTARVIGVLGLTRPERAGWSLGISSVYSDQARPSRVFVSPPVDGWTFVVGMAMPHPMSNAFVDLHTPMLSRLAQHFADVQYFCSYPPLNFYSWARMQKGELVRSFAVSTEGVISNRGQLTIAERQLGLGLFELQDVDELQLADGSLPAGWLPTEEHVMRLAAAWSQDPTRFATRDNLETGSGYMATVPDDWAIERTLKQAA